MYKLYVKYVVFCVWLVCLSILLTRFIYVVATVSILLLFIAELCSIYGYTTYWVSIHKLMCI